MTLKASTTSRQSAAPYDRQEDEGSPYGLWSRFAFEQRRTRSLLGLIFAISCVIYIAAICPSGFGLYHDDGIYVTAAKALATGQGYRVISLPGDPVDTKSPPLYPLLLSLVWKLSPSFPENLPYMMVLSVLAGLVSLILVWLYLTRCGYAGPRQALLVLGLTALSWRTVVLSSGVYSELFFEALSIGALFLTEKHERNGGRWTTGLCLGSVMGLAFLTRTSGLALVLAIIAYNVLRRRVRGALLPIALALCFILAWVGWSFLNSPTSNGENAAYTESYVRTFWVAIGGQEGLSHVLTAVMRIAGENAVMLLPISVPVLLVGLPYDWPHRFGSWSVIPGLCLIVIVFGLTVAGFVRTGFRRWRVRLLHIYVLVYVVMHAFWP